MRAVTRLLIVTALAFGTGCTSTDWIDRTLVTVDVTGTWNGNWPGSTAELFFELEQRGSTVKGSMRLTRGGSFGMKPGPIEGTVAGDLFRFRQSNGPLEGELTVNGDEMTGRASSGSSRPFTLRRVDSSSSPGAPPR